MTQSAQALCDEADRLVRDAQGLKENGPMLARAGQLYLNASALDTRLAAPYLGLAVLSYSMGKQKQAVGLLMQAKELEPFNVKVVQALKRFKKKAPPKPQPPPPKTQVKNLSKEAAEEKVSFKSQRQNPKPRIRIRLGLQKGCLQDQSQIELLQKALQAIGLPVDVSGTFDKKTLKAVQKYQYKLKLPVTGVTDKKLTQHLNRILDKLEQDPGYFSKKSSSSPQSPGSQEPSMEDDGPPPTQLTSDLGRVGLPGKVSSGPEVQLLQETLEALGYALDVNWQFDGPTSKAVRAFQNQHKLPLTGWVDAQSRAVLNPLIEVSIRQKELLDDLSKAVADYWAEQDLKQNQFWKTLIHKALKKVFVICESLSGEPDSPPEETDKSPLQQVMGSKGQQGVLSEGALVERIQKIFQSEGLPVKLTGSFDLQTTGGLRQYLDMHRLPPADYIAPEHWPHFNQKLDTVYAQERIRETVVSRFVDWCQFRERPWKNEVLEALQSQVFNLLEQQALPPIQQELGPPGRYGKVSKGIEVGILQYILNQLGFSCSENYLFDSETQVALKAYQKKHGLPSNGMLDGVTLDKINTALSAMSYQSESEKR